MQLKTVEERARTLGHKVIAAIRQFQEEKPRRQILWLDDVILDEFTQDRADILAVLREKAETIAVGTDLRGRRWIELPDLLTLIDTLLPGDVSK